MQSDCVFVRSRPWRFFRLPALYVLRSQSVNSSSTPASPPVAPVKPVADDYFGTKVVDPYRYMENLDDPEVQAWMKAQNDHARAVLKSTPGREQLLARIRFASIPEPLWSEDCSPLTIPPC